MEAVLVQCSAAGKCLFTAESHRMCLLESIRTAFFHCWRILQRIYCTSRAVRAFGVIQHLPNTIRQEESVCCSLSFEFQTLLSCSKTSLYSAEKQASWRVPAAAEPNERVHWSQTHIRSSTRLTDQNTWHTTAVTKVYHNKSMVKHR